MDSSSTATQTTAESATGASQWTAPRVQEMNPWVDLVNYVQAYAQQRPARFGLYCFGIGFILGWRLKPW